MERLMASTVSEAIELESVGHREINDLLEQLADEHGLGDDLDCITLGMFKGLIEALLVRDIDASDIIFVCVGVIGETLNYNEEIVH